MLSKHLRRSANFCTLRQARIWLLTPILSGNIDMRLWEAWMAPGG